MALCASILAASEDWVVPDEARERENPVEASPKNVAQGEVHYKKQCLMCHGKSLKGDGPAAGMFEATPADLSTKEARERLTDGEIFYKITEGRTPMPSMRARLSEEDRWKLIRYVRSMQAR